MYPTCLELLLQETLQSITFLQVGFNNLLEASPVDGLRPIIFQLVSLRYVICFYSSNCILFFFTVVNFLNVFPVQLSHGSSHGHSGVTNRGGLSVVGNPGYGSNTNGIGGSIPGILPTSAGIGNRNAVPGLGVSQILGNTGPRITSSGGNMVGGGNIGRSLSSGGGLSVPGLASRLNLTANSGSGSLGMQGQNRLMTGVLPQGLCARKKLINALFS